MKSPATHQTPLLLAANNGLAGVLNLFLACGAMNPNLGDKVFYDYCRGT